MSMIKRTEYLTVCAVKPTVYDHHYGNKKGVVFRFIYIRAKAKATSLQRLRKECY